MTVARSDAAAAPSSPQRGMNSALVDSSSTIHSTVLASFSRVWPVMSMIDPQMPAETTRSIPIIRTRGDVAQRPIIGKVAAPQWGSVFGPIDESGEPIPYDDLPLVAAVREGRPAHAEFEIHSTDGASHEVEVSAFPILTAHGSQGAIAVFWPTQMGQNGAGPA